MNRMSRCKKMGSIPFYVRWATLFGTLLSSLRTVKVIASSSLSLDENRRSHGENK
jgi:hypothetical protein